MVGEETLLKTTDPERVARALAARSIGASQREAGALVGVTGPAVHQWERGLRGQALARVSPSLLAQEKRRLVRGFFRLARLACSRAETEVGNLDGYRAALVAGIAFDQALRLSEETTAPQVQVNPLQAVAADPAAARLLAELASHVASLENSRRPALPEEEEREVD